MNRRRVVYVVWYNKIHNKLWICQNVKSTTNRSNGVCAFASRPQYIPDTRSRNFYKTIIVQVFCVKLWLMSMQVLVQNCTE